MQDRSGTGPKIHVTLPESLAYKNLFLTYYNNLVNDSTSVKNKKTLN